MKQRIRRRGHTSFSDELTLVLLQTWIPVCCHRSDTDVTPSHHQYQPLRLYPVSATRLYSQLIRNSSSFRPEQSVHPTPPSFIQSLFYPPFRPQSAIQPPSCLPILYWGSGRFVGLPSVWRRRLYCEYGNGIWEERLRGQWD